MRTRRKTKPLLKDNSGFTLIEIIAVLVILSILAVVAVPRYFDLQADAQRNAVSMAMAEVIGRINSHFAKELLTGTSPVDIEYSTDSLTESGRPEGDMGDFMFTVTEVGKKDIDITISGKTGEKTANWKWADIAEATRTIPRPGDSGGTEP